MTTPTATNGRVPFSWIATGLLTALLALGSALFAGVRGDLDELRQTVQEKAQETAALRAEMGSVHGQLTRIESKLDRLVEERR